MRDRNEYIDALKRRFEELKDEISYERQQVREMLEGVRAREEQAEFILRLLAAEGITPNSEALDGVMPMSVADMAYEVLARQSGPMHYRALVDLIMAEGRLIPGQDPGANLISHLSRDARFVRTGRGIYGLAEWGLEPAKKPQRRRRRKKE